MITLFLIRGEIAVVFISPYSIALLKDDTWSV